jgi:A/G-specific adenine glycosylase
LSRSREQFDSIHSSTRRAFRSRLLAWYRKNRREMPWRETRDPYRILLSEFMLQQTQVDTVVPYYHRFCERFPDVHALADAPGEEVLRLWEGLGYYARARNLHRAAASISRDCGGRVPDSYDELRALPGFGPYTTAAVLSIAYDRPHAVVDGNVIRVLSRWLGIEDDVTETRTKRRIQSAADQLLDESAPGDYNQALMELGATVCTPKSPVCGACPVARSCVARREASVDRIPRKASAKARPHHVIAAAVILHGGAVLLGRRPDHGLLGGLWELPGDGVGPRERLSDACTRGVRQKTGVDISITRRFNTLRHAFSHFEITLHTFIAEPRTTRLAPSGYQDAAWVPLSDADSYPATRTSRKLLDVLMQETDALPGLIT